MCEHDANLDGALGVDGVLAGRSVGGKHRLTEDIRIVIGRREDGELFDGDGHREKDGGEAMTREKNGDTESDWKYQSRAAMYE